MEAYVKPTEESVGAVDAWLNENGLSATPLSSAGDWLSVDIPVSKANDMLGAHFSVFTHEATGRQTIRTLQYSIPTDLVQHVDLIHPTVTSVSHVALSFPQTFPQTEWYADSQCKPTPHHPFFCLPPCLKNRVRTRTSRRCVDPTTDRTLQQRASSTCMASPLLRRSVLGTESWSLGTWSSTPMPKI